MMCIAQCQVQLQSSVQKQGKVQLLSHALSHPAICFLCVFVYALFTPKYFSVYFLKQGDSFTYP